MNKRILLITILIGIAVSVGLSFWLFYSDFVLVTFIIAIFLLVAFFPVSLKIMTRRFDFLEAENIFIIPYVLYSLTLPIEKISEGSSGEESTLLLYLVICLIGLVSFYMGYYNPVALTIERKLPHFGTVSDTRLALAGGCTALCGFVLLYFYMGLVGGLLGYLRMGYSQYGQIFQGDLGFLGYGFDFLIVAILALLISRLGRQKKPRLLTTAVIASLLGYFMVVEFLMGERLEIMVLLLGLIVIYHYRVKKINFKQSLVCGTLLYVILMMFGHARGQLQYGVTETIRYMINDLSFDRISPASSGEFTLGPPSALWELVELGWNRIPFLFGLSYIKSFGIFIPKLIWLGRPLALSEWRLATLHPYLYSEGGGLAYFTVAEGFLNFGYIGVAMHMFAYGILSKVIYQYLISDPHNKANILLYAGTLSWVMVGIRSDLIPSFKNCFLGFLLPTLFILLWAGRADAVRRGTSDEGLAH